MNKVLQPRGLVGQVGHGFSTPLYVIFILIPLASRVSLNQSAHMYSLDRAFTSLIQKV